MWFPLGWVGFCLASHLISCCQLLVYAPAHQHQLYETVLHQEHRDGKRQLPGADTTSPQRGYCLRQCLQSGTLRGDHPLVRHQLR